MVGTLSADTLTGASGTSIIFGNEGNDNLSSGGGDDYISGGSGDDYINGGIGIDTLIGGLGNDTFVVDVVNDVVIERFNEGTDTVRSATTYTLGENLENLVLIGSTNINATGNDLNNTILGNVGNNIINGGLGQDNMAGGSGNDIYVLDNSLDVVTESLNQGVDTVQIVYDNIDTVANVLTLGAGIFTNIENITVTGSGAFDLIGDATKNILIGNSFTNTLNGSAGDDTLIGNAGNDILVGGEGNDLYDFKSGDGNDVISENGQALNDIDTIRLNVIPANLILQKSFDDLLLVFGNDSVKIVNWYTANGKSIEKIEFSDGTVWNQAAIDFMTSIGNVNHAPVVTTAISTQTATEDSTFTFNVPANTFTDADSGDILSYSTTLADGGALPSWLSFDAITNIFSGTPLNEHVGNLSLTLTATDLAGTSVSQNFDLSVQNTNDAPTLDLALTDAIATETQTFSYIIPVDAFTDVDVGDVLSYTVTQTNGTALPSWLTFDAATRTISGTALDANIGVLDLKVTATDIAGTHAQDNFQLTINPLDRVLTGTTANDTLIGGQGNDLLDGGAGSDTMKGGKGNDTYIVDNLTDVVSENLNEGTDTVQSSVTYLLTANIENLILTGNVAINGVGNALDNIMIGNSANNTLNGAAGADTMSGGLGSDLYIVDNVGDVVNENAGEGTDTVQSSITYTLGNTLENLTLTGTTAINGTGNALDNILTGNAANNTLIGGLGNDTLNGGAGADTMSGGLGNDIYVVDNVGDIVTENAGEGTDTVQSSITYTLGAELENLTLTGTTAINGTGNDLNNSMVGNTAANILSAGLGNDTLNGGAGADNMSGGLGNDIYVVDNVGDVVTENAGEGTDTVQSSVTYTLGAEVENLTLTGTTAINATGNALDNILTGNTANNTLIGGDGNDTFNGGAGADTMTGGLGNDIYIVDNVGDVVTENASEGTDAVQSNITYTLGAELENLTLTGTSAINGTGNVLDNILTGNTAINTLVGGDGNDTLNGGAGADTMIGGLGNDIYVIDNVGDIVTESLNEGVDTIQTSITLTSLAANVENIILTGAAILNANGNALNNTLTGNAAANILDGGLGADIMIGGLGNDTYVVDNISDTVIESSSLITEIDLVQASVSFILSSNLEKLTLTGSANINATGNDLNNTLTGNAGNNVLDGGLGNDVMVGGLGDDTYFVDVSADIVTEAASAGIDTVQSSALTYTLAANLENLTLIGSANINGSGNAVNNILIGNSGDNLLDGGVGADTMTGGLGNDTYIIDALTDVIVENLDEGNDLVNVAIATISGIYTVADNVEKAKLTNTVAYSLIGNALDNTLTGNNAVNTLNGGLGADTMIGGLGNDIYVVDNTGDVVTETSTLSTEIDSIQSSMSYTLSVNVENLTLTGTSAINGTGNALSNVITGNSAANILDGAAGTDTLKGGAGDDTYIVDLTATNTLQDTVTEAASGGVDTIILRGGVVAAVSTITLGTEVDNLDASATGTTLLNLTGNALANFMKGNSANNTLTDTAGGNDILQGFAGIDSFNDTVGNNLFDGGLGNDIITAGSGRDILIGGQGNDTITTGTGYDVIVFNKGDGQDIINASTGADNTISLGGNFAYSDLSLTKSTNDLILKMGATDQITLKNWYLTSPTNKSVINLQVVAEAIQGFTLGGADELRNNNIENFNFSNLVAAFDTAGATANWQLTDARLTTHLQAGSDTAAIGGDLAYQYGKNSNLTGMGLLNAQSVIAAASFGQTAQTLNNPTVWQAEVAKLG